MDGNGRWAQARGRPRLFGHQAGARRVRDVVEACPGLGVKYLTVFAFSTENWKRPRHEVLTLMGLLKEYIKLELKTFLKHDLRFRPMANAAPRIISDDRASAGGPQQAERIQRASE